MFIYSCFENKAVLASNHNSSFWSSELVVNLPTPFNQSRKPMSTLRAPESTLHAGNGELSNPLPKAKATTKFSTLCRLEAAHRAAGQLPIQCNINTFVLGRSLGCWDQHPTCFSLPFNSEVFAHKWKYLCSENHPTCP